MSLAKVSVLTHLTYFHEFRLGKTLTGAGEISDAMISILTHFKLPISRSHQFCERKGTQFPAICFFDINLSDFKGIGNLITTNFSY